LTTVTPFPKKPELFQALCSKPSLGFTTKR
jgi:hypothetical protein